MKAAPLYFLAVLLHCHSLALAAEDQFYRQFLTAVGTNRWVDLDESAFAPLTDQTNAGPKLTRSKLDEVKARPEVEIAGVRAAMTMGQVVGLWGKPNRIRLEHTGAPRFSYSDPQSYADADVFFHPASNSVIVIWLMFPWTNGKPFLAPKVDECIRVLGEPTTRCILPNPLEPRKAPPKHWYSRMTYETTKPRLILYYGEGVLMAVEVMDPPAGARPDDYSIPFCLE